MLWEMRYRITGDTMKLSELAKILGGKLEGDDIEVGGVSNLDEQKPGTVAYVENAKRLPNFADSCVAALVMDPSVEYSGKPVIRVENIKLAFAKLLGAFDPFGKFPAKVYPNVFIDPSAKIGKNVTVMPFATILEDSQVGDGTVVFPNTYVGRGVKIGRDCTIKSGVAIMDGCEIGDRVVIHPNSVIGGDGFGYAQCDGKYHKIPQIGKVVIEDDVEIGACVTIDRATISETVVAKGVKIDNLVQIAHNCRVGEDTVLMSQVGIAGSTKVGKNCILAGQVGVTDHADIGDGVIIMAKTGVDAKHIESGKVLFGIPARDAMFAKRIMAAEERLPELLKTVRAMNKEKKE